MKISARVASRLAVAGAAALVSTATITPSAMAGPADAFYASGNYTYCDIKLLANFWGVSRGDAKITAGRKIQLGNTRIVNEKIQAARPYGRQRGVTCSFADADNPAYSYNDAVALAKYWGMRSPSDAKAKIGQLLYSGGNIHIRRSLRAARGGQY